MATLTVNNPTADIRIAESYWRGLSSLSDGVKLRLAAMLASSVAEKEERRESSKELNARMLAKYSGAWSGDESPAEIIASIRENSSTRKAVDL